MIEGCLCVSAGPAPMLQWLKIAGLAVDPDALAALNGSAVAKANLKLTLQLNRSVGRSAVRSTSSQRADERAYFQRRSTRCGMEAAARST
jgi:hypothetical protein